MKTTFETEEEKKFLRQLLLRGTMATEQFTLDPDKVKYAGLRLYCELMREFRAKCFEYMEENDVNQPYIDALFSEDYDKEDKGERDNHDFVDSVVTEEQEFSLSDFDHGKPLFVPSRPITEADDDGISLFSMEHPIKDNE